MHIIRYGAAVGFMAGYLYAMWHLVTGAMFLITQ